jgi:predicted DsbA family dithiol-disulfide isomerase
MAGLAFRFAMASPKVTAYAVEAQSYPDKAQAYQVRAVPHTMVNADVAVIGAVPETMLLQAIEKALS